MDVGTERFKKEGGQLKLYDEGGKTLGGIKAEREKDRGMKGVQYLSYKRAVAVKKAFRSIRNV